MLGIITSTTWTLHQQCAQMFFSQHLCIVLVHLCVSVGLNTGSYYAIGTLLNPIILYYFPVCNSLHWL